MQHPIGEHALLADSRTAALIDPDGNVAWLCWPWVNSTPLLFSILDEERGGSFVVRPEQHGARVLSRRYHARSLVLETVWDVRGTRLIVEEALDLGNNPLLVRSLRAEGGDVDVRVEFRAPTWDGTRASTTLAGETLEVNSGVHIAIRAAAAWTLHADSAECVMRVSPGERVAVDSRRSGDQTEVREHRRNACGMARDGSRCVGRRRGPDPRPPRDDRRSVARAPQHARRHRCRTDDLTSTVAGVVTNMGLPVLLAA